MSTSTVTTRAARLTTRNKVGLVLAALLALGDLASLLQPTPDGEVGPPFSILLVDGLLGVLTIVGVVIAWRSASRGAIRVVAGSRIISAITALPAFFVDVPAALKVLVGVIVLVTVAVVVMIMTPARDRVAVTD
jgi:hypothetical protein